jgi:hypothetical protein
MGSVLESDKTVYEKQQSSINVETATVEYLWGELSWRGSSCREASLSH